MVVVWVGFEVMVVMVGEVREDELQANFNDNERNNYTNISFKVDLPD